MMRMLIVEDDPFKLKQIRDLVAPIAQDGSVAEAMSLQAAMDRLSKDTFDVVLLDMALPSHSGESGASDIYSQPVGGLDALLFLSGNNRSERIIILTQYPTVEYDREHVPLTKLRTRLINDGVENVLDVVLFDSPSWSTKVKQALESLR